ncbi:MULTISPECIES: threonine ammonia-lyase [Acidiplasma]|uniref:threonine ammonia-lyase n=1 Tax=Acidiplasma cupricumulans TaxID=312540 RepID=A0A0Q0RPZ6_9ARCH|nr:MULTISPECIES: threonine ammonia-lyase [Acidiplasma]KJE49641.1 threonine dehydratase [Acidiplasma sp. MBA-1]KQB34323.1 threonine dehydratase [Acidiplasma cupricumulans]WMT55807.1 MAG: threonine ammonia-lyase [Acidiplasma sp.]
MITFDDVKNAEKIIDGRLHRTPLVHSKTFSDMFNADVYFKMEIFQKTGSFKSRGAFVKFAYLTEEEKKNGVITASAGNHAQGVAFAANAYNVRATIVMPEFTTPAKINAVESYGGHVILKGSSYDEAHDYAVNLGVEKGMTFIEAYNDEKVISGQATIGKEIMDDLNPDVIIVPIGGGGLISGISFAAKSMNPNVRVIGVESEKADSMVKSLKEGRIVSYTSNDTIADGIAVKYPGNITFEMVKKYVDNIVTVNDEDIAYALFKLLEREKVLTEPSGAVGLAALLENKIDVKNKKVAIVLSGGNINFLLLSNIIYRALEREDKLIRLEFKLPDHPGIMIKIVNAISSVGANIYHAEVDNLKKNTPIGYQNLLFTVNIVDKKRINELLEKLNKLGFEYNIVN